MPVYDTGFFAPIKRLLELGKIPLTMEQIDKLMESAPEKIARAEAVKLLMLAEDCYYAMLNTAQAVLMFMDIEPPPPSRVYIEIKRNLVESNLLKPEYAEWLRCQCGFSVEKDLPKGKVESQYCDNCKQLLIVEGVKELIDVLSEEAKNLGTKIELVSVETREGNQFKELGGIGAFLRYKLS